MWQTLFEKTEIALLQVLPCRICTSFALQALLCGSTCDHTLLSLHLSTPKLIYAQRCCWMRQSNHTALFGSSNPVDSRLRKAVWVNCFSKTRSRSFDYLCVATAFDCCPNAWFLRPFLLAKRPDRSDQIEYKLFLDPTNCELICISVRDNPFDFFASFG